MPVNQIDHLIRLLAKIPGLGPRSARRSALHLIKNKGTLLDPLVAAMLDAANNIRKCSTCGNLDTKDPCAICTDVERDRSIICVVEEVSDLWALERASIYKGFYHVLGGVLSPLDGIGPSDLTMEQLLVRAKESHVTEIILATGQTVDGKTTAHYVTDCLKNTGVTVTALAHGIPVGGELDYLDDGTLNAAIKQRRSI